MGKASSAKKVARAARAGGSRRSGQRRPLGFPVAIGLILVVGLLLVLFARDRRNADAFPRANRDHIHSSIDIYTCTADTSASTSTTTSVPASSASTSSDSTTSTTTTTVASSSSDSTSSASDTTTTTAATGTTVLGSGDVPGAYQAAPTDAHQDTLGIHTHGDGLIHIHPFADSVAGRKATLGVFLDQTGISINDSSLVLANGTAFTEGTTKCQGGKDAIVQVAKWDHADEAARGDKPNQIFTSGFDKIRLGESESYVIAFMPEGSTIKAKPDVQQRIDNVTDVTPSTTTSVPGVSESAPPASDQPTTTTAPASSSSSPSS